MKNGTFEKKVLRRSSITSGEEEIIARRRRKRSNSDGYLNVRPNFIANLHTNALDVLDCKSKEEYGTFDEENDDFDETNKNVSNRHRTRKTGITQVCSDLARFVSARMSLKRRTSPLDLNINRNLPLRFAVRTGDVDRVSYILETSNVDVNFRDERGVTVIHEAAIDGHSEILKILLEHDAEINKTDVDGYTCLDYAVYGGHFECATFLINRGATEESIKNGIPYYFRMT